jgi:pantetheine-phosphate adenylyltransferase
MKGRGVMKKAVYAGSFDPITFGHLWMIERGAALFDKLVVAIGVNPDKKYTFSLEDRLRVLRESITGVERVNVASFENQFLVNYAKSIKADFILRGIRDGTDFDFEKGMRHVNEDMQPGITTVFLMPPRAIAEVSSSLVKGLIGPEGWRDEVKRLVPPPVFDLILAKYGHR